MAQTVRRSLLLLLALSVTESLAKRIIGGQEVSPYSHGFQASLQYLGRNGVWRHYCGGTLVHSQWVVSAAHCWRPSGMLRVVLSEHDLAVDEDFEQVLNVSRIFVHPRYNYRSFDSDIMLMKLSREAVDNNRTQTVELPDRDTARLQYRTSCTVSGWGVTHVYSYYLSPELRAVDVQVIPWCKYYYWGRITDNMLCAGSRYGGKDSCKGDSGGPLVCNGKVEGIVSWGISCGYNYYPGVYTKVRNYVGWMRWLMDSNPR